MSSNPPNAEQQIQQAINEVQAENKSTPFPLEVTIPGTPTKFTGSTPQEVLDQLVNAQSHATRTIAEERAKRAELEARLVEMERRQPPPEPNADQARIQERYNLWAKNPTEATKQDLADMLGVPADRVIDVMKEAIGSSIVNKSAGEFIERYPDFPQTEANARMMRDGLAAKYGKSLEAATADNLEVVYHQLVREGRIQPQALPVQGLNNPTQPMPNIRGGSAPPDAELDLRRKAYTMPLNELKAVVDRLGANSR